MGQRLFPSAHSDTEHDVRARRCPNGCGTMSSAECARLLPGELLARLEEAALPLHRRRYCPQPRCSTLIHLPEAPHPGHEAICPQCLQCVSAAVAQIHTQCNFSMFFEDCKFNRIASSSGSCKCMQNMCMAAHRCQRPEAPLFSLCNAAVNSCRQNYLQQISYRHKVIMLYACNALAVNDLTRLKHQIYLWLCVGVAWR